MLLLLETIKILFFPASSGASVILALIFRSLFRVNNIPLESNRIGYAVLMLVKSYAKFQLADFLYKTNLHPSKNTSAMFMLSVWAFQNPHKYHNNTTMLVIYGNIILGLLLKNMINVLLTH